MKFFIYGLKEDREIDWNEGTYAIEVETADIGEEMSYLYNKFEGKEFILLPIDVVDEREG